MRQHVNYNRIKWSRMWFLVIAETTKSMTQHKEHNKLSKYKREREREKTKSVLISQIVSLPLACRSLPLFNKCKQAFNYKTSYNQKIKSKTQRSEIVFHVIATWPNKIQHGFRRRNKSIYIVLTDHWQNVHRQKERNIHCTCCLTFCCPLSDYGVHPKYKNERNQNELFIIEPLGFWPYE